LILNFLYRRDRGTGEQPFFSSRGEFQKRNLLWHLPLWHTLRILVKISILCHHTVSAKQDSVWQQQKAIARFSRK